MSKSFVIFASERQWRIGSISAGEPVLRDVVTPPGASAREHAAAVAGVLQVMGYGGDGVILAIPSLWCMGATLDTRSLPGRPGRQELLFLLEERLPVAAEELAADFVGAGDRMFAVAGALRVLSPIVDALEASGIAVEKICPASLLYLQHQVMSQPGIGNEMVVFGPQDAREVAILRNGKPAGWRMAWDDANGTVEQLRLADAECMNVHDFPCEPVDAGAVFGARAIARGTCSPWIDLRCDALAMRDPRRAIRRPMSFLLVGIILLCLSVCAAMLWRAHRYEQAARDHEQEQQQVFQKLYPNRPLPPDVTAYLSSEHRRLRGTAGDDISLPSAPSAMPVLHNLLSRLPTDVRYRLVRVRVSGQAIEIEGEARSHADADAFANALRQRNGFKIDTPRTESIPGGVSFSLIGRMDVRPYMTEATP